MRSIHPICSELHEFIFKQVVKPGDSSSDSKSDTAPLQSRHIVAQVRTALISEVSVRFVPTHAGD